METNIETNELLDRLPPHLKQYIKPQNYEQYTPINKAVWRYVMRKNVDYLAKVAHESYLGGLKKTGISIDLLFIVSGSTCFGSNTQLITSRSTRLCSNIAFC